MQINIDKEYAFYLEKFNTYLTEYLSLLDENAPKLIKDAMSYAMQNGGKRVRPVLCLAVSDLLGVDERKSLKFALAIEMIHAYSLVHDDLPAMDNDDFRRGKPSTHKAFGEAFGILAGDGLLNLAMEVCLSFENIDLCYINAMRTLFDYSGYKGMIGGQVLDITYEKQPTSDFETLIKIFENKTAKLLSAPLLCASNLANNKYHSELKTYGYYLGLCFQVVDDIMDVEGTLDSIGKTPLKDQNTDKLTSVKILGINGAKHIAKEYYLKAVDAISSIPNNEFLLGFAQKLFLRKK